MKNIVKISSSILIFASSLFAQSGEINGNRINLELTAGVNKFDSSSRLSKDNGTFYGIRGTIYDSVVDKYGFQLAYNGAYGVDYERLTSSDKSKSSDVHRFLANLVVDGKEEWGISPYILMGAGYEYLSDEIKGEVSQGVADLGIGFRYDLGHGFNTSLEGIAYGKFDSHDIDYLVNFALGYSFNSKKKSSKIINESLKKDDTPKTVINEVTVDVSSSIQNTKDNVTENLTTQTVESSGKSVDEKSYYIQLAALHLVKPFKTVLNAKKHGFENVDVLYEDDLKKVVIGPFESRSEAQSTLKKVKRTLVKNAYIIRY
jgi:hypothetical protein